MSAYPTYNFQTCYPKHTYLYIWPKKVIDKYPLWHNKCTAGKTFSQFYTVYTLFWKKCRFLMKPADQFQHSSKKSALWEIN